MGSNFGGIPPLTSEIAAHEHLKKKKSGKYCKYSRAFIFDWIFFIFAGTCNTDNHNILDEFEFRPDLIKDCGVSCP